MSYKILLLCSSEQNENQTHGFDLEALRIGLIKTCKL